MMLQYLKLPLTKGVLIVNSMRLDHHLLNRKGTQVPSTMKALSYDRCQAITTFNVFKLVHAFWSIPPTKGLQPMTSYGTG